MIGFIYVRDIPKMIVSGAIALLVLVGVGSVVVNLPGFMDLLGRSPDWVGIVIALLMFWGSISVGHWFWEWIECHFPARKTQTHVREVNDIYFHSMKRDREALNEKRRKG